MKTDKKVMAQIYRKMADNIEIGKKSYEGIQFYCSINKSWIDKYGTDTYGKVLYRIKPETIILRNGVTIPKPLDYKELKDSEKYYFPFNSKRLYGGEVAQNIKLLGAKYIYATKEQAIEASKALFGIE